MRRYKPYTEEERAFLVNNRHTMTNAELGAAIGRSESSVTYQLTQMRLRRVTIKHWTKDEVDLLRKQALELTRKELAEKFNTTVSSIKQAFRTYGIKTGRTGRFEKGLMPWIKGKKMPEGWGGSTKFKKGIRPWNTLQVGDIVTKKYVDGHAYRWVKVAEKEWRQLSYVNYENAFGPIPSGSVITYKDGNTLNCDAGNLLLITKQQHMANNTIARFPPELISTIKLLNKFKKKIADYEKQD